MTEFAPLQVRELGAGSVLPYWRGTRLFLLLVFCEG
jgi:hypothetical protein